MLQNRQHGLYIVLVPVCAAHVRFNMTSFAAPRRRKNARKAACIVSTFREGRGEKGVRWFKSRAANVCFILRCEIGGMQMRKVLQTSWMIDVEEPRLIVLPLWQLFESVIL